LGGARYTVATPGDARQKSLQQLQLPPLVAPVLAWAFHLLHAACGFRITPPFATLSAGPEFIGKTPK